MSMVARLRLATAAGLLAALSILLALPVLAQEGDPPSDPPARPTGLADEVSHDSVALRWDDPGDDTITGYQILRLNRAVDDLGEFHVHTDDTGSATTGYVDRDVEGDSRYVYRIKARNGAGLSPRSTYFNADTPEEPTPRPTPEPTPEPTPQPANSPQEGDTPPSTPTALEADPSHNAVTLIWDDPEDDTITGYRILRGPDSGNLAVIAKDTGSADTGYVDEDVEAETSYVYAVTALNDGGAGEQSGTVEVTTLAQPVPFQPTGLLTAASHNQVLLFWTDPGDDTIAGYRILRGPGADSLSTVVDDTGSAATSYTDDTVEAETTYVYAVQARNGAGDGDRSDTTGVLTPPAPATGEPSSARQDGNDCGGGYWCAELVLSNHSRPGDGVCCTCSASTRATAASTTRQCVLRALETPLVPELFMSRTLNCGRAPMARPPKPRSRSACRALRKTLTASMTSKV